MLVGLADAHRRDAVNGEAADDPRLHATVEIADDLVEADPAQHRGEQRDLLIGRRHQDDRLVGRQEPAGEGREVVHRIDVDGPRHVRPAEAGVVAHVDHQMALLGKRLCLLRRQGARRGKPRGERGTLAVDVGAAGEVVGGIGHAAQQRLLEGPLGRVLESWVELPLVADGAHPHRAHGLAAERPCTVGRVDQARVGQLHQLVVQVVVELRGQLVASPGEQVRPPHVADEQRVAREGRHRLVAPRAVGHDVADAVGGVPGCVEHLDVHVLDVEAAAVAHGHVAVLAAARLRGADRRARPLRQVHVARDEVGVQVGLEDMRNLQPQLLRRGEVVLNIALRVDDRTCLLPSEEVGEVSDAIDVVLLNEHVRPLSAVRQKR